MFSRKDAVTQPMPAQEISTKEERKAVVPHYLQQLNLLTVVRHLSLLLMEVQKHRGASSAVLEGNAEFESRVLHQQEVIQRLMDLINLIDRQYGTIIPAEKWQEIEKDWQALVHNWRSDSVITNFEFHSHFIDRMVKLVWELTAAADYFSAAPLRLDAEHKDSDPAWLYSEQNHRELVQIALKLMPEMLENIAKLRGLATHASVRGYCDSDAQVRFGYLLQSLNMNKERLRVASRSLQHEALRAVPALPSILLHEHRLVQLQQLIEQKIMSGGKISIKSLDVFDFATEIIEIYSRIIRDGINAFQQRIERGLLA